MATELVVLRLVHILSGMFWVGAGLFSTYFLAPALKQLGPGVAGAVMGALQKQKLFTVMPVAATLTILSGARLMWIVSGGDSHWFVHRAGHFYSVSATLAIVAFVVSLLVARPAMVRAGKLAQSAASDAGSKEMINSEMAKLQKRAATSTGLAMFFLIMAAAGMAVARYL